MTYIYLVEKCFEDPLKVYIGKTFTPKNRRHQHKRKYGIKASFIVIDTIDSFSSKDWKPLETYWIEQFRQWGFNILNQNSGGGGSSKWNEEQIKNRQGKGVGPNPKISAAKINHPSRSKTILQYDFKGNFVKEYPSISEARRENPKGDIDACVQGKQKRAGDFMYLYKEENTSILLKVSPYIRTRSDKKYFTLEEKKEAARRRDREWSKLNYKSKKQNK
jgi:hypothetical protein